MFVKFCFTNCDFNSGGFCSTSFFSFDRALFFPIIIRQDLSMLKSSSLVSAMASILSLPIWAETLDRVITQPGHVILEQGRAEHDIPIRHFILTPLEEISHTIVQVDCTAKGSLNGPLTLSFTSISFFCVPHWCPDLDSCILIHFIQQFVQFPSHFILVQLI